MIGNGLSGLYRYLRQSGELILKAHSSLDYRPLQSDSCIFSALESASKQNHLDRDFCEFGRPLPSANSNPTRSTPRPGGGIVCPRGSTCRFRPTVGVPGMSKLGPRSIARFLAQAGKIHTINARHVPQESRARKRCPRLVCVEKGLAVRSIVSPYNRIPVAMMLSCSLLL